MNTTRSKEHIKYKYNIGDVIEGEVNVYYILEKIVLDKVIKDKWTYIPGYLLISVAKNGNFPYTEEHINKLIKAGCILHKNKKVLNEDKNRI